MGWGTHWLSIKAQGFDINNSGVNGNSIASISDSFTMNETHLVSDIFNGGSNNNHSTNVNATSHWGVVVLLEVQTILRTLHLVDQTMPKVYMVNLTWAEFIVINSTDPAVIAEINAYLSNKWGLKATVDSDMDGVVDASDTYPVDAAKALTYQIFQML